MPPARDPIKRLAEKIAEDDPRWDWRKMGNRRRGPLRRQLKVPKPYTEGVPLFTPHGSKTERT